MDTSIHRIIDDILAAEGSRYTNHPSDRGGPTKYGITLDTLAKWRGAPVTAKDVRSLKEAEARRIYEHRYIVEPGFDVVRQISEPIAIELIDTGVNMGTKTAVVFLQRALTAFNRQGKLYHDLLVDGMLGVKTLNALRTYLNHRGNEGAGVLLKAMNHLQGERYIQLAEKREQNEDFVYGWIKQRS